MSALEVPAGKSGPSTAEDWIKFELRILSACCRDDDVAKMATSVLSDMRLTYKPANWLLGKISESLAEVGEFDIEGLFLEVKSRPKGSKGRKEALALLRTVWETRPARKPKSAIETLAKRLRKIHAMEQTKRAIDAISQGNDEQGLRVLESIGQEKKKVGLDLPIPQMGFYPRYVAPQRPSRISSGLFGLDAVTGGIGRREVVLVIADTGHGKSFLVMNVARHCIANETRVLLIDTENGIGNAKEGVANVVESRLWSSFTGIPHAHIAENIMLPGEQEKLDNWLYWNHRRLNEFFRVVDGGFEQYGWDEIEEIIARTIRSGFKPDVIALDSPDNFRKEGKFQNRHEQIADLSNGTKSAATKFDCACIATSQVSGGRETEGAIPTARAVSGSKQKAFNAGQIWGIGAIQKREESSDGFEPRRQRHKPVVESHDQEWWLYIAKMRGREGKILLPLESNLERAYMQVPPPGEGRRGSISW